MKHCQLFFIGFIFVLLQISGCVKSNYKHSKYVGVEQVRPLEENVEEIRIIPREEWTNEGPMLFDIVPMTPVYRITIHHTAMPEDDSPDMGESTKLRLQKILYMHKQKNNWADIGYHYAVDYAGNVWEARNIKYQGAHAKGANNEGNIGIVVIGNFEVNHPTEKQKRTLEALVEFLKEKYSIKSSDVYPHEHFHGTKCPGKNLIPFINQLKRK